MRHRWPLVHHLLPRRPLATALRWAAASARAPSRRLSFTPLALIFRRARSAGIPIAIPWHYKSRDGENVVIAPRLAFHIQLTAALGTAVSLFPDLRHQKDRTGSGRALPIRGVRQPQTLTLATVISEAIAERRWLAVNDAALTLARRTSSPVFLSVIRLADIRSSAGTSPPPKGFFAEIPPLSLQPPTPVCSLPRAGKGSPRTSEARHSGPPTSIPDLPAIPRQSVWATVWGGTPTRLMRAQARRATTFVNESIAQRCSGVVNSAERAPEIGSSFAIDLRKKILALPSRSSYFHAVWRPLSQKHYLKGYRFLPVARIAEDGSSAAPKSIGYSRAIAQLERSVFAAAGGWGWAEQRVATAAALAQRRASRIIRVRLMPASLRLGHKEPQQPASTNQTGIKGQRWRRLMSQHDSTRRDGLSWSPPHRTTNPERAVIPVEVIYRDERVASSPIPKEPTAPATVSSQTPKLDIDRLTGDIQRQLEKRIRIERERRGRL